MLVQTFSHHCLCREKKTVYAKRRQENSHQQNIRISSSVYLLSLFISFCFFSLIVSIFILCYCRPTALIFQETKICIFTIYIFYALFFMSFSVNDTFLRYFLFLGFWLALAYTLRHPTEDAPEVKIRIICICNAKRIILRIELQAPPFAMPMPK